MKVKLCLRSLLLFLSLLCVLPSWGVIRIQIGLLTYVLYDDKTAEVVDCASPSTTGSVVTVANKINYSGTLYTVTSIGESVFNKKDCNTKISSITLSAGIKTIGNSAFKNCSGLTSINIPDGVTSIGSEAFCGCSGLTSVNIPDGVTSIGSGAFWACSGLTSINIPAGVTSIGSKVFSGCSGLTSVNIPDGVTSIGSGAFFGCRGLTSINIPDGVTSIGSDAFGACSGLTSVNISDGVTSIGSDAFWNCSGLTSVNIPNGVTSIGNNAFEGCSGLTSVNIPNVAIEIGQGAFSDCTSLTSVLIPPKVKYVGNGAFKGCIGLTSAEICEAVTIRGFSKVFPDSKDLTTVSIVDGTTYIYYKAFSGCDGLTSITIPNSVTTIGDYAFEGCSGLTSIAIPNSVKEFGNKVFTGCSGITSAVVPECIMEKGVGNVFRSRIESISISEGVTSISDNAFEGCGGLTSISIPIGVTSIGNNAFARCVGLTSMSLPNGVTSIGNNIFDGCTGLTSITIPNSVTSIADYAFRGCSSLPSVTLRSTVTKIGKEAFMGCKSLSKVTLPPSLNSIGQSAFRDCDGLTAITVPSRVTAIGDYAFAYCDNLETATLNSTAAINATTFEADYKLKNIKGGSVYSDGVAIYNAEKTNLICIIDQTVKNYTTMPETVAEIGFAFKNCSNFTSVQLPEALKTIPDSAFVGCENLLTVTIPSASVLTSIGKAAFWNCKKLSTISLPAVLTTIGSSAFAGCSNLSRCDLPTSLCTIDDHTFEDCEKLVLTELPSSLAKIGDYAFKGCNNVNINRVPTTLQSIGFGAFKNCLGLKSISLPNTTEIKGEAFMNCSKLSLISAPKLSKLSNRILANCENLQFVQIPSAKVDDYTTGWACFKGCAMLKNISLPEVTTVKDSMFYGCTKLQTVALPTDLTHIGKSAFEGCSRLTTLPEFLNASISVSRHAFWGCSSLKKLRFRATDNPFATISQDGNDVVDDIPSGLTIYVPGGAKAAYEKCIAVNDITIIEDHEQSDVNELKQRFADYTGVDYQHLTKEPLVRKKSILTDVSQLSANYIEEGEGSLAELLDDDDNTYFLSAWSQDNPNGENHYLQVDMQKATTCYAQLMFKKRSSTDGLAPTMVKIYAAESPEKGWTEMSTDTLIYDAQNVAYSKLDLDYSTRYIRAEVLKTADNNKENNNLYFSLNKFDVIISNESSPIDGVLTRKDVNASSYGFSKDKLVSGEPLWSDYEHTEYCLLRSLPDISLPVISQNMVLTYRKCEDKPEKEQADYLHVLYERKSYAASSDTTFKADYSYRDGTMGIFTLKGANYAFVFALDNKKSELGYSWNSSGWKRYLKDIHVYDRPCKIDLLSKADSLALATAIADKATEDWIRADDYDLIKAYCDKVDYLAASGRYADFLNEDYRTFYADYPAIVPKQVKAGIVKQQGDELLIDYIYNEGDVIPAETGVILKGNCRGNAYIMQEGTTDATAPEGNLLHGTIDEEMTDVEGCNRYYKLSYDKATNWHLGFYWGAESAQPFMNKPYKAFLALPESMNAVQMDSFTLADMEQEKGGVTTTVNDATVGHYKPQGIYSLDGRRVNVESIKQLPVGVYIVNGKKVIIK